MNHRNIARSTILTLILILCAAPIFASSLDDAFNTLSSDIASSGRGQLQNSLLSKVQAAQQAASRKQPCVAINVLNALRNEISAKTSTGQPTNGKPLVASAAATLDTDIIGVVAILLGTPEAASCGGAAVAPAGGDAPVVELITNTTRELHFRMTFPQAHFTTRFGRGKPYVDVAIDGMGDSSNVGEPHIPRLTRMFAVPIGASINVEVVGSSSYSVPNVTLWPLQGEPVDLLLPPGAPDPSVFADKPFTLNSKLYALNSYYPSTVSAARPLGGMRDLLIGGVELDGAQFNPFAKDLRIYTSLDVKVTFGGKNTDVFADQRSYDEYELPFQRIYRGTLMNEAIISRYLRDRIYPFCGDEVVIITSPALRPAADTFANARRAAGYQVGVYETGSAVGHAGSTNTEIKSFLYTKLTTGCHLRPSYVILFGTTDQVPTFLVPCGPGGNVDECNIASDLPYVLVTPDDLFADAAYGRIPVSDLDQANAVVNKIVTYETTPPAPDGDPFYVHATTTSYFQPATKCVLNEGATGTPNCDENAPPVTGHWDIDYDNHQDTRGFTITAERIGNAMRAKGYWVDRLYTTDNADVVPLTYYDGTPIPSYLRRPAFGWDANGTQFLNAYNEGRFIILHRDHGWPDGWAAPDLWSGDVPLMTNGTKLPVVFGINCASAQFDVPGHPSFVERQLTRIGGGAVAGIGDTRNSPSFPNNHMAIGLFDSLFPNLVPTYGSATPVVHMGEVLLKGKEYMATQEGIDWQGAGDTYVEHYLYGLLGDPTMQIWIGAPRVFDPKKLHFLLEYIVNPLPGDPPYIVKLPPIPDPPPFEEAVATLMQGGEVIGRGIIRNGTVSIAPQTVLKEGSLSVVVGQLGYFSSQGSIEIEQTPIR